MKNQKGITLIALVITIIVLLILAGVSIAMLTGESGILTKAGDAQEKTRLSDAEEIIKLAISEILVDNNGKLPTTGFTKGDFDTAYGKLDSKYTITASEPSGDSMTVTAADGSDTFATFTVNVKTGKVEKQ